MDYWIVFTCLSGILMAWRSACPLPWGGGMASAECPAGPGAGAALGSWEAVPEHSAVQFLRHISDCFSLSFWQEQSFSILDSHKRWARSV